MGCGAARRGINRMAGLAAVAMVFAACLMLWSAHPVQATTLERMSLEQLAERATTIVLAKTLGASAEMQALAGQTGSGFLQTRANNQVLKVLKGAAGQNLSATALGGTLGSLSAPVDGMPTFTAGETCLLFLDRKGRVIGGYQGKLTVADGMVTELKLSLDIVEARILKATGQDARPAKSEVRSSGLVARPISLTLEQTAAQQPSASVQPLAASNFLDGFESGITSWTRSGTPTWVRTSYRESSGSYSAYCGSTSTHTYPADAYSVMQRGPFDISGTDQGTFSFDLWLDTESGYDGIVCGLSPNLTDLYGVSYTGYSSGWQHIVVDLEAVPTDTGTTVDLTGESSLWIVFIFISDEDYQYEGAYVDNVSLTASVPAGAPVITSISPGTASAGTGSRVTIAGTNFGAAQAPSGSVNFFYRSGQPTIPGGVLSWSNTSIVAEVPVGEVDGYSGSAGSGPVTVTNAAGLTSASKNFTVTFGYGQEKWATNSVGFRINPNTADTASEKALVDAAAATWSVPSLFEFTDAGTCSTTDFLQDGNNDVFWSADALPEGVIAAAWPRVSGSTITEVDICFNDYYTWGDGTGGTMDVQSLALHEMGHWLELRDLYGDADSAKVMYGFGSTDEVKRTLTADDLAGIKWIYGPTRYDNKDPHVVYSPDWQYYPTTSAYEGAYARAAAEGSSVTVGFTGRQLDWVTMKGTTGGIADVYVDDVKVTTGLNLYASAATYQQTVWSTGTLPDGKHTVRIVRSPASAAGKYVTIDAVDVIGSLAYPAPAITSVSPTSGSTAGGTQVIIRGYGFTGGIGIPLTFGEAYPASSIFNSTTQITAVVPAHAAGTVRVQVTTVGGTTPDTPADDFTFVEPGAPTIASLSPSSGSVDGGTQVTLAGTEFLGVSSVTFGGLQATGLSVNAAGTQITCTTPAHAAGAVTAEVTTATGSATTSYTYLEMPTVARYDQTDVHIVKSGTWANYASTLSYSASYGRASTALASATVYFTGTRFDWIAMKGTTTGKADVYVDGVKVTATPIDLAATSAAYQVSVFTTGTLPNTSHIVKIERSAASAAGKYLTIDAVDIYGTISVPPVAKTRYEQTNTLITKTGTWSNYASAASSGGSYGRSSTGGSSPASATIKFVGTRLDYIALKGTTTGYAEIWVDGAKVTGTTPINLYASPVAYQQTVYSTGTLPFGLHAVKIVRASASASGKYLTLDAFDVWGWIAS
jgi:hypothetical protein